MRWKVLDDFEILAQLKGSTVTCRRGIFLNDPIKPPANTLDIQSFYTQSNVDRLDIPYAFKFEIHAHDTNPLTAVVIDGNSKEPVGCFVWAGTGGTIQNATDQRLILLGDLLHAMIFDEEMPCNDEYKPQETCSCCGHTYDTSIPDGGSAVEMQLNDGSRIEGRDIEENQYKTTLWQHATDAQWESFLNALRGEYRPTGELHFVRVKGNGNQEALMISVLNQAGKKLFVFPDGSIDVFPQLG